MSKEVLGKAMATIDRTIQAVKTTADQPAQWLEEALFECIKASGIIRKDITGLSVTELLFFSQDLKRMLASAPQPAHQEPVAHIRDEALERLKPPMLILSGVPLYGYAGVGTTAVYTAPPQRQPLTDQQVKRIALDAGLEPSEITGEVFYALRCVADEAAQNIEDNA